jgi:DNA excision repair protein ERCC-4
MASLARTSASSQFFLSDEFENIVRVSRDRVFKISGDNSSSIRIEPVNEAPGKWDLLKYIIREEIHQDQNENILIMVENDISSVKGCLLSNELYLKNSFSKYLNWNGRMKSIVEKMKSDNNEEENNDIDNNSDYQRKRMRRCRGGRNIVTLDRRSTASNTHPIDYAAHAPILENCEESNDSSNVCIVKGDELSQNGIGFNGNIIIARYNPVSNSEISILETYTPRYVIMYDPRPSFIRQLELFNSLYPETRVKTLYFLMYEKSIEEQNYLSLLRKERESFEKLIHDKSIISIPKRILSSAASMKTVLVDVREFRSSVPFALYSRFKIIPLTLVVGDYVLSPNICVER